tara:strand:- start:4593 stop:5471 length:879 start_codon:yes stop_codon:yes gene_type:complete
VSARLIDGLRIAAEIRQEVKQEVLQLKQAGIHPGLAAILVGDDPASKVYVSNKERACNEVGIYTEIHRFDQQISEEALLDLIDSLNKDPKIHGILVQLPLPAHIKESAIIESVKPIKDVDGFHPNNIGHLAIGDSQFIPATPAGVIELFNRENIELGGKHAVIIGRSNIVGKPIAIAWMQKGLTEYPTVTICHTFDTDIIKHTVEADILVVAVGSPEVITGKMVKKGAVVIDIGINRVDNSGSPKGYHLVGDVKFDEVKEVAGAITPVPGGVGPMTVAMLLKNTVRAAYLNR